MADTKISEMDAASDVAGSDLVAIVQGGANKKASIDQLLTAAAGEDKVLVCADGQTVGMRDDSNLNYFTIDSSTGTIAMEATGPATLHCAGLMTLNPGGNLYLKYTTANGGWWASAPPQEVWGALDRLAAAVAGLLGTAIP